MKNEGASKIHLVEKQIGLSEKQEKLVAELEERWGLPYVTRDTEEIRRATGLIYSKKSLANLDSLGEGPAGKFNYGRRVAYPSRAFFEWVVGKMH